MRFQPSFILGLSFFAAFVSAEASNGHNQGVAVEERSISSDVPLNHGSIRADAFAEIENAALHVRNPNPKGTKKKPKSTPKAQTTKASVTTPNASKSPSQTVVSTTKASSSKSSSSSTVSSTKSSSAASSSSAVSSSVQSTASTLSTTTTGTKTGSETSTGTQSSTSATSTSSTKSRVRCGDAGSLCTSTSCNLPRADNRVAINRRAWKDANGDPAKLFGKAGNTDLSQPKKRTAWIDFAGGKFKSTTIKGLTGCTALIAISEKGMYAAHIWEAGTGPTLVPSQYKATLASIEAELSTHKDDLDGGHLYLMIPQNPDQPGHLLYDTTRFNAERTEEETEPGKHLEWTELVPRVAEIRQMATRGSGLQITREDNYMPPLLGVQTSSHMTAQYDPDAGNDQQAYGVWADNTQMGTTHKW